MQQAEASCQNEIVDMLTTLEKAFNVKYSLSLYIFISNLLRIFAIIIINYNPIVIIIFCYYLLLLLLLLLILLLVITVG